MLAVQMRLAPLTALRKLILLGNQQSELKIPEGSFQELEVLQKYFPIASSKDYPSLNDRL